MTEGCFTAEITEEAVAAEKAGISEDWGFKTVKVKAVVAFDNEGNFVIHGSSDQDYKQMRAAIATIWEHDPENELIQTIEFDMRLPDLDLILKPQIKNAINS